MSNKPENRTDERCSFKASVMLYVEENSEEYYYGHICNRSQGGMYITTDADLKGNQCYMVKISNNDGNAEDPEKYTECYGIVRWAEFAESSDYPDSSYKYGYGLEYTELATHC